MSQRKEVDQRNRELFYTVMTIVIDWAEYTELKHKKNLSSNLLLLIDRLYYLLKETNVSCKEN